MGTIEKIYLSQRLICSPPWNRCYKSARTHRHRREKESHVNLTLHYDPSLALARFSQCPIKFRNSQHEIRNNYRLIRKIKNFEIVSSLRFRAWDLPIESCLSLESPATLPY